MLENQYLDAGDKQALAPLVSWLLQAEQLAEAGITASHISATALAVLGKKKSLVS
jgi:hypothetical protein